jgi:hypothetical protein
MCEIVSDFYHMQRPWLGKTDGVLNSIPNWKELAPYLLENNGHISLESVWKWLKEFPFQGPFHAFEVVTDLRHTELLNRAPDINTWANSGPGAQRGLARIHNRPLNSLAPTKQACNEMIEILNLSRDKKYWPNNEDYPPLELREIEHSLCEFDKYLRVLTGQGRPRSIYR